MSPRLPHCPLRICGTRRYFHCTSRQFRVKNISTRLATVGMGGSVNLPGRDLLYGRLSQDSRYAHARPSTRLAGKRSRSGLPQVLPGQACPAPVELKRIGFIPPELLWQRGKLKQPHAVAGQIEVHGELAIGGRAASLFRVWGVAARRAYLSALRRKTGTPASP